MILFRPINVQYCTDKYMAFLRKMNKINNFEVTSRWNKKIKAASLD